VKQLTEVGVVPFNCSVPEEKPATESTIWDMKDEAPVGVVAIRSDPRTRTVATTPARFAPGWRRFALSSGRGTLRRRFRGFVRDVRDEGVTNSASSDLSHPRGLGVHLVVPLSCTQTCSNGADLFGYGTVGAREGAAFAPDVIV